MAEYIKKEPFLDKLLYMGYFDDNNEIEDVANSFTTKEVVERFKYEMMAERCKTMTKAFIELQKDNKDLHSKIAKAIKEIIEYRDDKKNDFCEVEVGAINGALEILKNIGE